MRVFLGCCGTRVLYPVPRCTLCTPISQPYSTSLPFFSEREREGGREGGKEGRREGGKEGGRER